MEDRFYRRCQECMAVLPQEEAAKLGSDYVGTEHLLLGIAHEEDTAGGKNSG